MSIMSLVSTPRQMHWDADLYDRGVSQGLFDGRSIELIQGVLLEMSPQEAAHSTALVLCDAYLRGLCPAGTHLRVQMPLAINVDSRPEPDLAVVTGSIRSFVQHHPTTARLIVEVAGASLAFDRGTKAALYARAGVPEYWIINLVERCVEVHREPQGEAYTQRSVYDARAQVATLLAPDQPLAVAELLP